MLSQSRTMFRKWKKLVPPALATFGDTVGRKKKDNLHSRDTIFYLLMLLFCCRFQLLEFSCKLFLQLLCCLQEHEQNNLLENLCL